MLNNYTLHLGFPFFFLFYLRWFPPMLIFFSSHIHFKCSPKTTTKGKHQTIVTYEGHDLWIVRTRVDDREEGTTSKWGKPFKSLFLQAWQSPRAPPQDAHMTQKYFHSVHLCVRFGWRCFHRNSFESERRCFLRKRLGAAQWSSESWKGAWIWHGA